MEKRRENRNESDRMIPYTKYFDFDMLNKHVTEQLNQISGLIWLAIYISIIYTFVKWFLDWDN